jgi:hypothetical protein
MDRAWPRWYAGGGGATMAERGTLDDVARRPTLSSLHFDDHIGR